MVSRVYQFERVVRDIGNPRIPFNKPCYTGDEDIMPSYTFVSTANAFVLCSATPVFVDIRSDTMNIDECLIEHAVTPRTRAIVAVYYAGVAVGWMLGSIGHLRGLMGFWLAEE